MRFLATLLVVLVALLHFGFMALEMFLWEHPIGLDVFSMTAEEAASSAKLAANQGLYNGFLGLGLLWGLVLKQRDFVLFLLLCVVVAGIYGAVTTGETTIFYIQSGPALAALVFTLLARRRFY